MHTNLSSANYMTNGQIYQNIIRMERNFEYDGEDVEIVPHVPEEIIRRCEHAAKVRKADFVIVEVGGTVGEYQNSLFIEANRIMKYRDNRDVIHIHVAYLPTPVSIGEMKSKPMQTSVRLLNASGIQPDFLIGRSDKPMYDRIKSTLSWICNVDAGNIISAPNVDTIYQVPLVMEQQKLTEKILSLFGLKNTKKDMKPWKALVRKIPLIKNELKIAIVGKYFETGDFKLADVYISVVEALKHGAWANNCTVKLEWVSSATVEKDGAKNCLQGFDGIVVPGGFGSRGVEGIIESIKYARQNKIPYLGLCYGLQLATVEFARNVARIKDAHTTEVDPKCKNPIIHIMPDQEKKLLKRDYGATMRLGAWDCLVTRGSTTDKLYTQRGWLKSKGSAKISERHRHRYEFNNKYRERLEKSGLIIAGTTPDGKLVEIIELKDHPFFVATQFHPEFKSRPLDPHPLFYGFTKAALKRKK